MKAPAIPSPDLRLVPPRRSGRSDVARPESRSERDLDQRPVGTPVGGREDRCGEAHGRRERMSSGADNHDSQPQTPEVAVPAKGERGCGGAAASERREAVVRLLPIAVLVLSGDRYFRAAATMLLSRRGCTVLSAADEHEADAQRAARAGGRARRRARPATGRAPEAGGSDRRSDRRGERGGRASRGAGQQWWSSASPGDLGEIADASAGSGRPALDKWGPFERLYQAIADRDRARRLPLEDGVSRWPDSARRPGAV